MRQGLCIAHAVFARWQAFLLSACLLQSRMLVACTVLLRIAALLQFLDTLSHAVTPMFTENPGWSTIPGADAVRTAAALCICSECG